MRQRRTRVVLAGCVLASGVLSVSEQASAFDKKPACVDLGFGAVASTTCEVPAGSILYVAPEANECLVRAELRLGQIRFRETEARIVPRLALPTEDLTDIKLVNDFYRANATAYGGQVRFFWKTCFERLSGNSTVIDALPIAVPITDPLLDIRADVEALSLSLRLPGVSLSTLPEPEVFFGLKVNNPAWLAVTPDSWQSVAAGPVALRGWLVTLNVRPTTIRFTVDHGGRLMQVPCDPAGQRYVSGSSRFPTEPDGFTAQPNWLDPPDDPLPLRDCVWTPRAKGTGSVAVAITYEVTAQAGGFLFRFSPRVSTTTVPIDVAELRVVNVKP